MQAKMETAAEQYRRIAKEKREAKRVLVPVECEGEADSCGMVWQCERQPIDFWVTSGILPMALVEVMVKASQKAGAKPDEAIRTLAADKIVQSIEFSSKVVLRTAVEPKIVDKDPDEVGENEISREEVMTCCYKRILNWQMAGGDGATALETFRQG